MKVRDLMTTELFTLRAGHMLGLAEDIMAWQNIRHIPVVDDQNRLVGLLTHRDLLKASLSSFADVPRKEQHELLNHIRVKDIMTKNVASIDPDSDLRTAAALMIDKKIGCLPVVEEEVLVGILTEADFLTLAWEAS